jgi:hypothetical protein
LHSGIFEQPVNVFDFLASMMCMLFRPGNDFIIQEKEIV